ncbi:hypothetical protein WA026_019210 [Henosepilachna vigintioctopunctata]|uniref:Uncharacterized protein n=1 Tax=Henosepilachna vigintioctopunctata TaxID=420089 RepID=A0AAW1V2D3_9CUCU
MADGIRTGVVVGDFVEKTSNKDCETSDRCQERVMMDKKPIESVNKFYLVDKSDKLYDKLCSNNAPKLEEELMPCEGDCRRKRCVDRYDSSESSDRIILNKNNTIERIKQTVFILREGNGLRVLHKDRFWGFYCLAFSQYFQGRNHVSCVDYDRRKLTTVSLPQFSLRPDFRGTNGSFTARLGPRRSPRKTSLTETVVALTLWKLEQTFLLVSIHFVHSEVRICVDNAESLA